MAGALKYRLEAYSKKYRDVYRVDIWEDGYTGDVQYKNIAAGKLHLEKREGKIQPTILRISIQADTNFEYLGFFQYDARKHPVYLYKNDVKIWSGFIQPESYQEPYVNPPYDVEITATDGLGLLGNYTFKTTDLAGRIANSAHLSRFDVIDGCINKLGLALDYDIAVDLFEQNMSAGNESMLHQNYFNGFIFNNEKCDKIIEQLLPFGATLTQHNNKWLIRRPYEDAEKTHLNFDFRGDYQGTITGEQVLQMGAFSEAGIWPHVSPLLTMQHAWSKAVIKNNYGKRLSFLKNYDFSAFTLRNWTNNTGVDVSIQMDNDGNKYLLIPGYMSEFDHNTVYQSVDVKQTPGYFIFSVKAALLSTEAHWVWIGVSLTDGTNTVWLTEDGWQTTYKLIILNLTPAINIHDLTQLKIFADSIPFDGTLKIDLYRLWYNADEMYEAAFPASWNGEMNIVFSEVIVYTSDAQLMDEDGETEVEIRANAAEDGGDIDLKPVDVPDVANAKVVYDFASFYKTADGYETTKMWQNNGGDLLSYTDILKEQLIKYFGNARQIISGCEWRGTGLHLNSIAQHIYNYSRKYYADYGSWDILGDAWNITWIEVPGTDTGTPGWITEEGMWDDSEAWKDDERWEDEEINIVEVDVSGTGLHDISSVIEANDVITVFKGVGKLYQEGTQITSFPHTFTGDALGYSTPADLRGATIATMTIVRPFADAAGDETIVVTLRLV